MLLTACGPSGASTSSFRAYLAAVEPIRLGVNRLLQGADPILAAYRERHLSGQHAAAAMGRLEQSFAVCMVDIDAVQPSDATLASINAPYAQTYVLEDTYLSALVAAFPVGGFSTLPDTESAQRDAIIDWRVELDVLALKLAVLLPPDLQQAGRGEIAPAVSGST